VFIKLTTDKNRPVYVRKSAILSMERGVLLVTFIYLESDRFISVKETPEEIIKMLEES
jgi:hypothetical protein